MHAVVRSAPCTYVRPQRTCVIPTITRLENNAAGHSFIYFFIFPRWKNYTIAGISLTEELSFKHYPSIRPFKLSIILIQWNILRFNKTKSFSSNPPTFTESTCSSSHGTAAGHSFTARWQDTNFVLRRQASLCRSKVSRVRCLGFESVIYDRGAAQRRFLLLIENLCMLIVMYWSR